MPDPLFRIIGPDGHEVQVPTSQMRRILMTAQFGLARVQREEGKMFPRDDRLAMDACASMVAQWHLW